MNGDNQDSSQYLSASIFGITGSLRASLTISGAVKAALAAMPPPVPSLASVMGTSEHLNASLASMDAVRATLAAIPPPPVLSLTSLLSTSESLRASLTMSEAVKAAIAAIPPSMTSQASLMGISETLKASMAAKGTVLAALAAIPPSPVSSLSSFLDNSDSLRASLTMSGVVKAALAAMPPPVELPFSVYSFPRISGLQSITRPSGEYSDTSHLILPNRRNELDLGPPQDMVAAYELISWFEDRLREFIDEQLTMAFGTDWHIHRIPGDIRQQWKDKRSRAIQAGEQPDKLISYADFGDYEKIIVGKDNWDSVFKQFFRRKESIQESFNRLGPIRICTMHCRILHKDNFLLLYCEILRLLRAIGS